MTAEINILPNRNLVVVSIDGYFEMKDAYATFNGFTKHPDFRPGMNALYDLRKAKMTPKPHDIQSLAGYVTSHQDNRGENYKVAFIASEGIERAAVETYRTMLSAVPAEFKIFEDEDGACAWLGC